MHPLRLARPTRHDYVARLPERDSVPEPHRAEGPRRYHLGSLHRADRPVPLYLGRGVVGLGPPET